PGVRDDRRAWARRGCGHLCRCRGRDVLPGEEDLPVGGEDMATLRAVRGRVDSVRADLLVIPVVEGAVARSLRKLPKAVATRLERRTKAADFRGRSEDVLVHHGDGGSIALVGLGAADGEPDVWRRAGGRARKEAERQGARRTALQMGEHGGEPTLLAA